MQFLTKNITYIAVSLENGNDIEIRKRADGLFKILQVTRKNL